MTLSYPFWNREQRRLRCLWRCLLLIALLVAVLLVLQAAMKLALPGLRGAPAMATIGLAICACVYAAARWIDRRRSRDLGLAASGATLLDMLWGVLLGLLLQTGIVGSLVLLGWATITRPETQAAAPILTALLDGAILALFVGLYEELVFRGYFLRNFAEALRPRRAKPALGVLLGWALSSALFGLVHGSNPNATPFALLNIVLAGFLLGLPPLFTGRIGLSVGLHAAWNFAQGPLYGLPVSGAVPRHAAFVTQTTGPTIWTGGAFGPEGGLSSTVAVLLAMLLIYAVYTLQRRALHGPLACYEPRQANPASPIESAVEAS